MQMWEINDEFSLQIEVTYWKWVKKKGIYFSQKCKVFKTMRWNIKHKLLNFRYAKKYNGQQRLESNIRFSNNCLGHS